MGTTDKTYIVPWQPGVTCSHGDTQVLYKYIHDELLHALLP